AGTAGIWALVRGIRTGWLRAAFSRVGQVLRRPTVSIGTILIVLAIGIPATLKATKLRRERERVVMPWLNQLESHLTDVVVDEIRKSITGRNVGDHSRIPIPPAAHALLDDSRVKDGN